MSLVDDTASAIAAYVKEELLSTRDVALLELKARVDRVLIIEPGDHATSSRDYGRGFAEAIRQVREILNGH